MKARVKAIFSFEIYVNGEYSNEASYIKGTAITFNQAIAEAKKCIRNFSANQVQIFLKAGDLAVADVTMYNREITVDDYNQDYIRKERDMTEEQIKNLMEWVYKYPGWLSESTPYARGYKNGIIQAQEIIKNILNI